jgi:hypothetical protein
MFQTFGSTYFPSQHDSVKLGSSHGNITLSIGPHQITFDQVYHTGFGRILDISISLVTLKLSTSQQLQLILKPSINSWAIQTSKCSSQ